MIILQLRNFIVVSMWQWRTQEFCSEFQQMQLRTERMGIWGGSPLFIGSGGSCNLVPEISIRIVKFSNSYC